MKKNSTSSSKIKPKKSNATANLISAKMDNASISPFFKALIKAIPNPQSELKFQNLFELTVSVILSAQATDKSVNLVTPALFKKAPTAFDMQKLGAETIAKYIKTIGLWRSKAKNLERFSQQLIERHNGHIPQTRRELEALAGVGRKTANVVLNIGFNLPTLAVDTHIFRVGRRTGLAPGKNVRDVEDILLKRIPDIFLMNAHHQLLLLGRYTCKARTPECWRCPVQKWCQYPCKNKDPHKD